MARLEATAGLETHQVLNQPEMPGDRDLWRDDPVLRGALAESGAALEELARYGETLGRAELRAAARAANRNPPELRLFDSGGRRLDEVGFHPDYHRFMRLSAAAGYHAIAWEGGAAGHLGHAAMVYLASQVEPGHCCPLTMTHAAVPVIAAADLPGDWRGRMLSRRYDPSVRPMEAKTGVTLGMAMTEKQGGSDVRANSTRAERDGVAWRLTGHKWFCSAPMSDGFLTLAQAEGGLTCFLVPRWLEDGRNAIRLQRLKDKLGNRSNASAEIEYHRALAWQLGGEGDGVRTIVEMVHHTRLDTAMAPAGLMRAALREAHHWVSRRSAFQKRLIDQPLMRAVLADLVLDWQGSLTLGLAVARSFDASGDADRAFARIGVALAKYLANKLCPTVVAEAMEVLGGMGYVEDTPLPLLYREAPLNGIWEGSGNVICLDALRTLAREPLAREALAARLEAGTGLDRHYDAALAGWRARWGRGVTEAEARWFVEQAALLLSAAALLEAGDEALAGAFIRTRLGTERGRTGGTIPADLAEAILAKGFPFHD
ncbi:acyl-CoA dehydrogenase family protein [Paracoccus siganidrum]|uniref:DNA alkylation response protein n=1 Tax=Paracoccus siganidrum TaxID=1276757 RepID=A0A419A3T3_9RHOB|nr:acyl-CoA dehydrogenase family protein [Paracoccus siganidrum]RJL08230.1 DNA alkylation response protein [Paracoccus siganidrum]RMC35223.1 DNA alkylation response protein [Paracoccus siganidrum]